MVNSNLQCISYAHFPHAVLSLQYVRSKQWIAMVSISAKHTSLPNDVTTNRTPTSKLVCIWVFQDWRNRMLHRHPSLHTQIHGVWQGCAACVGCLCINWMDAPLSGTPVTNVNLHCWRSTGYPKATKPEWVAQQVSTFSRLRNNLSVSAFWGLGSQD
jgi:hypothetical protein